ncbi:L,D-transpeptidase [Rhodococcus sp. H29-C3]|uniref:L,D-transpeptidase n=1 Tax=Rhodococcus sp. H29-C3 TaxID=3046307 RepID=UPI0024B896B4|nr:L,D-transpeptidase [Rhodococcus sp. H29-C3]MDJ0359548.1 L,D-transpeptidase [Rhodococcus sp. H29-C3]
MDRTVMAFASRTSRRFAVRLSLATVTAAVGMSALIAPAQAAPLWPGGPEAPTLPAFPGSSDPAAPVPQPQIPRLAPANFSDPSISPSGGEVVGVAQPIAIRFNEAIGDRGAAERAIRITTSPAVDGHFYWINDSQVRWLPNEFYPAHTQVTVEAAGSRTDFSTGDSVITTADDATHTMTITRNGEVVRTMLTSMGKAGHETPNGTYLVGEKFRDMYMDSSTYGVPVDSPEGYRTYVEYATRISYSGIFVHAAPWSVDSQGYEDVSHGCLNVSTEDGKWFFENSQKGDPVVVVNSGGGTLSGSDGLGDWNR